MKKDAKRMPLEWHESEIWKDAEGCFFDTLKIDDALSVEIIRMKSTEPPTAYVYLYENTVLKFKDYIGVDTREDARRQGLVLVLEFLAEQRKKAIRREAAMASAIRALYPEKQEDKES